MPMCLCPYRVRFRRCRDSRQREAPGHTSLSLADHWIVKGSFPVSSPTREPRIPPSDEFRAGITNNEISGASILN